MVYFLAALTLTALVQVEQVSATPVVSRTIPIVSSSDANGMNFDGTNVWISDFSNGVFKVNASTGAQSLPITGTHPEDVCSDGTHVWVSNYNEQNVTEYDISSGVLVRAIPLGADGFHITCDGAKVWVESRSGLYGINAATGSIFAGPIASMYLPFSDGAHLWALSENTNTAYELNLSTGSILYSIALGATPRSITSDGAHAWVGTDAGVTEINCDTGQTTATFSFPQSAQTVSSNGSNVLIGTSSGYRTLNISTSTVGSLVSTDSVKKFSSKGSYVWALTEVFTFFPHYSSAYSISEIMNLNSVIYANGGGSGTLPTQADLASGSTFTLPLSSLSKSGYNFAGWSDGTNAYQPGATYTMSSSPVALTAIWVTPPVIYSKPSAPSNVTASLSNGTATVTFTPGTSGNLATYNQIDMFINGQAFGNICNVTGATSCPIANLGPDATFTFTVTAVNSKGSATSAVSNAVSYASPTTVPPTTTTTTTTVPPTKLTITCVKGKITKKVTAVSPVCPAGYKKK